MNREKINPLQSPLKMNIKRSVPNISSSKRSCEYAGCKNTTSKGKMYCGLHYLEGVERSSKRSCDMHKCESCGIMISQKKQLCKPCKRISNLGIERMNKDRYIPQFTGSAISKKDNIRMNNRGPITDKTLPGWNKNCEYCGNEFEVTLREKELGFFGLLGAIRKQVKTVFKADNTKNWDYSKNPDQHFCSSCLRKGDPIDWYCPRCKITKNKCDCFDIVKCTECGTEVTKMNLYGTCCFECYMDHKNAESPYETY